MGPGMGIPPPHLDLGWGTLSPDLGMGYPPSPHPDLETPPSGPGNGIPPVWTWEWGNPPCTDLGWGTPFPHPDPPLPLSAGRGRPPSAQVLTD